MTPTLDQCRELERLYPGQWEETRDVYRDVIVACDGSRKVIITDRHRDELLGHILCPAPSLGEMVRVLPLDSDFAHRNHKHQFGEWSWTCVLIMGDGNPDNHICTHAETPESALAAALIAAGGGESQHRASPQGGDK